MAQIKRQQMMEGKPANLVGLLVMRGREMDGKSPERSP